ncbi:hypothetical protein RB213_010453, partial [Colletotrichum asianum]
SCISQATPENPCPQARRFLRLGTFDLAPGNLATAYPYSHRGKQRWGADADAEPSSEKIPWNNCHTDLNFHNAQKKK